MVTLALLGWGNGGCAARRKPPPPLQAPSAEARVRHFPGTSPGGSLTRAPSATTGPAATTAPAAGDAFGVSVEWVALREFPPNLAPLGSQTRVIAASGIAEPLLVSPRLTRGVRVVTPGTTDEMLRWVESARSGGRAASIAVERGALPVSVTAAFTLDPSAGAASASAGAKPQRGVEVYLYRPPAAAKVATSATMPPSASATGTATTTATKATTTRPVATTKSASAATNRAGRSAEVSLVVSEPSPPGLPYRERVFFDTVEVPDAPVRLGLVLPFSFPTSDARCLLAVITIDRGDDSPEHREAIARVGSDLRAYARAATQPGARPSAYPAIAAAVQRLGHPAEARATLLFLSDRTGAELTGDTALVADDQTVAAIATRTAEAAKADGAAIDPEGVAWMLESATFAHLASLQATEKLPAELTSVLTQFAGEAGRHAASLEALSRAAKSRAELDARLTAENYIYLEDAAPGARVRAYDWLASRSRAPTGYDPLGPLKQRRAALEQVVPAAAATTGGAGGANSNNRSTSVTGGAP